MTGKYDPPHILVKLIKVAKLSPPPQDPQNRRVHFLTDWSCKGGDPGPETDGVEQGPGASSDPLYFFSVSRT